MIGEDAIRRDNFMRLARMANAVPVDHFYVTDVFLEKFAEMVAAEEREACAKLCEEMENRENPYERNVAALDCASAIRARGDE